MSVIAYCPRGGQEGVLVLRGELERHARKINAQHIDQFIPLPAPGADPRACFEDHTDGPTVYWEEEGTGSHGWCCSTCGEVIQWG